jgi:hypothetical protein
MPLFTRTFELLAWLMPVTNHFPRSQRFLVTKRLLDAGLDFQEAIVCANHVRGRQRLRMLRRADELLDRVRLYLRLAERWKWLNSGQYHHAAAMVSEMGRLLGGWQQSARR